MDVKNIVVGGMDGVTAQARAALVEHHRKAVEDQKEKVLIVTDGTYSKRVLGSIQRLETENVVREVKVTENGQFITQRLKYKRNPHPKSAEKDLKRQFSARQLRKLEKKMGRAAAQVRANTEATPE